MKKKIALTLCIASVICTLCTYYLNCNIKIKSERFENILYSQNADTISKEVLRLHVKANSDTPEDQIIKIKVKDMITSEYSNYFSALGSKEESIEFSKEHIPEIEKKVDKFLTAHGFDYSCKAEVKSEIFPDKYYSDILFPSGEYTALKIILGEGKGKNWWCVLYPPLCFLDIKSDEESREYHEKTNGQVQIRSRILRWVESFN